MATRTYYTASESGTVKRLDNLAGAWVDISLSTIGYNQQVYDVKTRPGVSTRVVVVGSPTPLFSMYGVWASVNSGAAWGVPTGSYQASGATWYEISWPTTNDVFICGSSGYVAVSSNGGGTFTLTPNTPTPTGAPQTGDSKALHFISGLIGVVAFEGSVFKTIDGGNTWTYLNGGLPVTTTKVVTIINGIHISANEQVITFSSPEGVYRSIDSGATFQLEYDFTSNEGLHLTWTDDNNLWATGRYNHRIRSVDGGANWTVLSPQNLLDPVFINAAHIYTAPDGFYNRNGGLFFTSDNALTGTLSDTTPSIINSVWTSIDATGCFLLVDCAGVQPDIITRTDLTAYVGQIIQLLGASVCYTVSVAPDCEGAVLVTVAASFATCDLCDPPGVPCYILTDCSGEADPISASTDLSAYIGLVIQIVGSTTCWQVTESEDCECPEEVEISAVFSNCATCPAVAPTIPTIPFIEPGYDQSDCSQKLVDARTAYADAWYKKVLSLRLGINVCFACDPDVLYVRKALLELQQLYDPLACACLPSPDPDVCPVEIPAVAPDIGVACADPESVIATLELG